MRPAALLAEQRAACDPLRYRDHVDQVARQVPARIVEARALDADLPGTLLESGERLQAELQIFLHAEDPDVLVHADLEVAVDLVGALAGGALEGSEHLLRLALDFALVEARARGDALRMLRRVEPRAPPEHQEVGERVPSEPVGAVEPRRHLARRVEAGHGRARGVGI